MSCDVIIIGAGPGGLATAKAMLDEGLTPLVFEASSAIGGQWNFTQDNSGIWQGMHTNTSRATTVFSDLSHQDGTLMFPSAADIHAYLDRYAKTFGLLTHIHLNTRVTDVEQTADGFSVKVVSGDEHSQHFAPQLVVASGRYNRAQMPAIEGLESFNGTAIHAFDFDDPATFSGQKVLTIGNSISGLEIAAELAKDPTTEVVSACRKPRYIIQKLKDDVPADWRWFNRSALFVGRTLPPEAANAGLREQVVALHGNPADFGGLEPSENMMEAGLGQCQDYLPLVAEGRIRCQSIPNHIAGNDVSFPDGTTESFDAIIAGTGYPLNLSYLSQDLLDSLNADDQNLDLFAYTFAPSIPNLAFVGQLSLVGPYFPALELQARLTAMVFSGQLDRPEKSVMDEAVTLFRHLASEGVPLLYHNVVVDLATAAKVEPKVADYPTLASELVFGPIIPAQFRLTGHGAHIDGEARFRNELSRLDRSPGAPLEEQLGLLNMLASTDTPWPGVLEALSTFETS